MVVATREPPALGATVDLRLQLPAQAAQVHARSVVVSVLPVADGLWHVGVRFTQLNADDFSKLVAHADAATPSSRPELQSAR
jgi:hypothetical protein